MQRSASTQSGYHVTVKFSQSVPPTYEAPGISSFTCSNSHWCDPSPLTCRPKEHDRQLSTTPLISFGLHCFSEAAIVLSLKEDDNEPWKAGGRECPSTLSSLGETRSPGWKPSSSCIQVIHREIKLIPALVHQWCSYTKRWWGLH